MAVKNSGHGTAYSTMWTIPSAYVKKNGGNPAKLKDQSHHYEYHRPHAAQGSWPGDQVKVGT